MTRRSLRGHFYCTAPPRSEARISLGDLTPPNRSIKRLIQLFRLRCFVAARTQSTAMGVFFQPPVFGQHLLVRLRVHRTSCDSV